MWRHHPRGRGVARSECSAGPVVPDVHDRSAPLGGLARDVSRDECGAGIDGRVFDCSIQILEARGIADHLVNARHVRNVPGRKSDVSDAEWFGTCTASASCAAGFRPTEALAALRAYVRHRHTLVELAAMHIQRMQKALLQE